MNAANKVRDPLAKEELISNPHSARPLETKLEEVLQENTPETIISNIPITKF